MRPSRDRSVKNRVPQMVRLLHLFVVAIFAVIGLGAAKPAPVFTAVAASLEVPASTDTVRVARWVAAPSTSQRCQNEDERALDQIGPVEESLDDDDDVDGRDAHLARAEGTFPAFDITRFEPNAGRAFRSESSIDPSRFAIGCGFARGPPRARA